MASSAVPNVEMSLEHSTIRKIIGDRNGRVLSKDTLLKADQYVPIQWTALAGAAPNVQIAGAPNFRRIVIPGTTISLYGVGQPTQYGIRALLTLIKAGTFDVKSREQLSSSGPASDSSPQVLWINLREEPIVYINHRPFVLREADSAWRNLAVYSGATPETIQEMENSLKADVVAEAEAYHDMFVTHTETADKQIVPSWEFVDSRSVQTPEEIYTEFGSQGLNVQYERLPLTPESPLKRHIVERLIALARNYSRGRVHIIFNCQMGQGRSTSAMILTTMLKMRQLTSEYETLQQFVDPFPLGKEDLDGLAAYHRADYPPVLSLISTIEFVKKRVDIAIDICGALSNLRANILEWKKASDLADEVNRSSEDTAVVLRKAVTNLQRYLTLLVVMAYMNETVHSDFEPKFSVWSKSHPEFTTIVHSIKENQEKSLSITSLLPNASLDDAIVSQRKGTVLSAGMILKADHFPTITASQAQLVPGAPNLRKFKTANIYACAVPTAAGIRSVLNHIALTDKSADILWVNLREEPQLYINKAPFVLRFLTKPMRNISIYGGILGDAVEKLELRLKADALAELPAHHNQLLCHDETTSRQVVPSWESIKTVETPFEIYDSLKKEGWKIRYARVPITTESTPEPKDFDELLKLILSMDPITGHIIFNCQIGRGRSTTASVVAYLLRYWAQSLPPPTGTDEAVFGGKETNFAITNSLVRLLPNGQLMKQQVDHAIDEAGVSQNLRWTIVSIIKKMEAARTQEEVRDYTNKAASALHRYVWLIIFNSYLSLNWEKQFTKSFVAWLDEREEIMTLLNELKHSPAGALVQATLVSADQKDPRNVVTLRKGNVLSPGSLIKFDHFPGCQRKGLEVVIEGAPNFRRVEGLPVYGVAIPTAEGIQNVLKHLATQPRGFVRVVWTSLREEPIVYVNSRPYVVRSSLRAYDNLEHTGISVQRVEQMEDRLVEDLALEGRQNNGAVVIHDEAATGELHAHWEPITNANCILTPRQVYNQLTGTWNVKYNRVAITDEQSPTPDDFIELLKLLLSVCPPAEDKTPNRAMLTQSLTDEVTRSPSSPLETTHFIFNCQMGRGRTTTGMVVACLYLRWAHPNATLPRTPAMPRKAVTEFKAIARLTRALKDGLKVKTEVDMCVDMCSTMQNLREAIKALKSQTEAETDAKKKEFYHERTTNYLKRYFFLLLFASYLYQQDKAHPFQQSFDDWLAMRGEFQTLLDHITLDEVLPTSPLLFSTPLNNPNPNSPAVPASASQMKLQVPSQAPAPAPGK